MGHSFVPFALAALLSLGNPSLARAVDTDGDTIPDGLDNCPTLANPLQNLPPVKLNGPYVVGGALASVAPIFVIAPDGSRVVYRASQDSPGVVELYSVSASGGTVTKLNGAPLPTESPGVIDFELSPDGTRVVYRADQDAAGVVDLYSVPIAGGTSTKLNTLLPASASVTGFAASPDSARVLYAADHGPHGVYELYSVPIAGGQAPTKLNAPLPDVVTSDPVPPRISPDGAWVVFMHGQELYSVPITGGAPPTRLNGTLPPGGSVGLGDAISADSSRVVYGADQQVNDQFELYSVPIGGGTAVRLNGTLGPAGDVTAFILTPDGTHVVFQADAGADELFELYGVPIGGGTPVKLNDTLTVGGDASFGVFPALTPDSTRLIYLADQEVNDVIELYSVPVAGGRPPVKLNTPLPAGGDVSIGLMSPDGSRLIYRADQDVNDLVELYSVPVAGGQAPIQLNPPMQAGSDVSSLFPLTAGERISPDGRWVLYRADQNIDEVSELFRAPTAGGPVLRLNGQLALGGDVGTAYGLSADGSLAAYIADQSTNDVVELYATPLDQDTDEDGTLNPCDCAPADPDTFPGALEVNDGVDNQCPGQPGHGIVDELDGDAGFYDPEDANAFYWPEQFGAETYQAARSTARAFDADCTTFTAAWPPVWIDAALPAPGAVFYYLARPLTPHAGSWGRRSSGVERTVSCAGP